MRALLTVVVLVLLGTPAHASAFRVDTQHHVVQTSKLLLQFDTVCPERVLAVYCFPFSGLDRINGDSYPSEFSGQMIQGLWVDQGPVRADATDPAERSWTVISESSTRLVLSIQSHAVPAGVNLPRVRTDYTFWADSSFFQVDRAVYFGACSMSTCAFQPYVLRVKTSLVDEGRWLDAGGAPQTTSLCPAGCTYTDWQGDWSSVVGPGLSVTVMNHPATGAGYACMNDDDLYSHGAWSGPYSHEQGWNADMTWRLLVHFSTTPGDDALENRVYAWWTGLPALGVADAAAAGVSLAVAPNPVVTSAVVTFALPAATRVDVGVFDPAGRRLATLADGELAAGPHTVRWSGAAADGRRVAPGIYLVRLRKPTIDRVRHVALVRWRPRDAGATSCTTGASTEARVRLRCGAGRTVESADWGVVSTTMEAV